MQKLPRLCREGPHDGSVAVAYESGPETAGKVGELLAIASEQRGTDRLFNVAGSSRMAGTEGRPALQFRNGSQRIHRQRCPDVKVTAPSCQVLG
jgi:hypothetical protein